MSDCNELFGEFIVDSLFDLGSYANKQYKKDLEKRKQ